MSEENKTENLPEVVKPHIPIVNGQLQPNDAAGLYYLAGIMSKTDMVPDHYKGNPQSTFVAIQMGMEVGLRPMQALQNIAVIKGKPTIYADGITGLLHGSKKCEYINERFVVGDKEVDPSDLPLNLDEWPDGLKAVSEIKRVGSAQQLYRGTFSVADAKRMGKWNKPNSSGTSIWRQYPARMLMWRARTYAARDGFSDVLKGLGIFEEVQDYDADMVDTNGMYEVPEPEIKAEAKPEAKPEVKEKSLFDEMCESRNLDAKKALEYCKQIHKITDAPILTITIKATQNPDEFEKKFKAWYEINYGDPMGIDDPPDHGPDDVFQDPPAPEVDEEGYSADMPEEKKAEVVARTAGDESGEGSTPDKDVLPADGEGGVDARPGETGQDYTPGSESIPAPADMPPTPKSTIKKWIGLRGVDFKDYVPANPQDFEGIKPDEYKRAIEKWDALVKKRYNTPWPLGSTEKQPEIEFPKQNLKQHLVEMQKDYPDEVKKSLEKHRFAKGALSEEAAGIVVQDVIDIIGGKQIQ